MDSPEKSSISKSMTEQEWDLRPSTIVFSLWRFYLRRNVCWDKQFSLLCLEQWFPLSLSLSPFHTVPHGMVSPSHNYFCCCFLSFCYCFKLCISMFSDGLGWPLWRSHLTTTGVVTHRLRTTGLEGAASSSLGLFTYRGGGKKQYYLLEQRCRGGSW